jgi:hypothetical protein
MRTTHWLITAALLASSTELHALGSTPTRQEAAQPTPEAAKKLAALIERFNKQQNEVYDAYQAAEGEEQRAEILKGLPGKEFVPEFRAVAQEAKGTDTAVKAWLWVLRLSEDDAKQGAEVLQVLLAEHIQSPALAELSGQLRYGANTYGEATVIDTLRVLVEDSPHEKVRAGALFTLGGVLLESAKAENKAEGRDCFEAVIAEYGELAYRGSSTYAKAAQGYLYELDHLQIGMAAPEFESVDENGVPWKLSDYRGKVVVVDFWGFW